MELLAPEARLVGDSGGKAQSPLRILESADHVARFLVGVAERRPAATEVRLLELNAGPAVLVLSAGKPDSVIQLEVADGRVACVYIVRNPDKLERLALPQQP